MKRIEWIDIAKGIGMILIIIGHTMGTFAGGYLMSAIYAVNVPIFFVLSGYLFKEKDFRIVIKKGIRNLLIPYLAVSVCLLIVSYLQNRANLVTFKSMGSVKSILTAIFYGVGTHTQLIGTNIYIPAIGAIWFLIAMFLGNILFNLTLKLIDKNIDNLWILPTVEAVIGFVLAKWIILPLSINAVLICQVFYLFGYLIKQNKVSIENNNLFWIGLFTWTVSAVSGNFWVNVAYADMQLPAMIGACGASYVIIYIARKIEQSSINHSIIRIFGRYSLIVMCVHLIDLNVININNIIYNEVFKISNIYSASLSVIVYRVLLTMTVVMILNTIHNIREQNTIKNYSKVLVNSIK